MSAAHKQREREAESLNLYVFLVINWVFFVVVKTVNGTEREAKKEMGLLREKGNKVSREVMIIFAPWNMYGNGGLVII
jgi:hypothetical protein